jgi:hypothetical protein
MEDLPEMECLGGGENFSCYGFTADQMREYARKAVLAERERCAKLAESNKYTAYVPPEDGSARDYYNEAGEDIAAAIRSSGGN